jgi:NAD(P)-dependent dehydrogenase (short-subunit alcohol dehydrogenase family)
MDTANKANLWRSGIQIALLLVAVGAGVIGIGRCKKPEQAAAEVVKTERRDVIRGVEGRMLVVHHHGADIASDKKIDELLLAFAAEPGPRNWTWICLSPPDIWRSGEFPEFS